LYHLAASDTSIHRPAINHLTARDITIYFEKQSVSRVVTVDSVFGVYVEPQLDSTERKARASADSTKNGKKNPTKNPPKGPVPTSVVPLPANPTKPPAKPPTRQ
jgi:hypothetical protein